MTVFVMFFIELLVSRFDIFGAGHEHAHDSSMDLTDEAKTRDHTESDSTLGTPFGLNNSGKLAFAKFEPSLR